MRAKIREIKHKFCAFTLAEVLITLGIIGVVAALTIPSLIQKNQDQTTVSKLKKVYSTLSNAYSLAVKDNGQPNSWGLSGIAYNAAASQVMMQTIMPYLNVQKDCGLNTNQGCWANGYKFLDVAGTTDMDASATNYKVRLADGTSLTASYDVGNCTNVYGNTPALSSECGVYDVDINGNSGPNQIGKDLFRFYLTNFGIVPVGVAAQTGGQPFDTRCVTGSNGYGCAGWVIYNENLDYTRCSALLSWAGAHSCP